MRFTAFTAKIHIIPDSGELFFLPLYPINYLSFTASSAEKDFFPTLVAVKYKNSSHQALKKYNLAQFTSFTAKRYKKNAVNFFGAFLSVSYKNAPPNPDPGEQKSKLKTRNKLFIVQNYGPIYQEFLRISV